MFLSPIRASPIVLFSVILCFGNSVNQQTTHRRSEELVTVRFETKGQDAVVVEKLQNHPEILLSLYCWLLHCR